MKQATNKLREMMGRTWYYKGEELLFQGIELHGEDVKLLTSGRELTFTNPAMIYFFMEDCKPCENLPAPVEEKQDEVMSELKGILMENIKNLKKDPSYIPQAQAISKQVQTLINLSNLEINVRKMEDQ